MSQCLLCSWGLRFIYSLLGEGGRRRVTQYGMGHRAELGQCGKAQGLDAQVCTTPTPVPQDVAKISSSAVAHECAVLEMQHLW